MNINDYDNETAKDFVKRNFQNLLDNSYIIEWLEERNVKIYVLYENSVIKCFVLLTKLSKDPEKKHIKPVYLNYIFTIPEYRRNGLALYLLNELKSKEEMTVFCTNDIEKNLVIKANFNFHKIDPFLKSFPIYRFP